MENTQPYETLDPENWEEMRALAHRMVDDALTYLETARERPVWQPIPEEVAARFTEQAPHEPAGADAAGGDSLRLRTAMNCGTAFTVHGSRELRGKVRRPLFRHPHGRSCSVGMTERL